MLNLLEGIPWAESGIFSRIRFRWLSHTKYHLQSVSSSYDFGIIGGTMSFDPHGIELGYQNEHQSLAILTSQPVALFKGDDLLRPKLQ